MKNVALILIIAFFNLGQVFAQGNLTQFFDKIDAFAAKYVKDGRVAYSSVKEHFMEVKVLSEMVGEMDLSKATSEQKKAFYINAYNVIVIYKVAKHYPMQHPMEQAGFFDKTRHKVAGEALTLNALEIKKLLLPYKDPRIHFVLTCAAKGCPKLANFAYRPATLDRNLNLRAMLSLNDEDFIKYNEKSKKVELSKIFQWYKKDFERGGQTVVAFINKYRKNHIAPDAIVTYYEYDWNLNEQK